MIALSIHKKSNLILQIAFLKKKIKRSVYFLIFRLIIIH